MKDDLVYLPARTILHKIRNREVSAVEVVTAFLTQIEECNPILNAICDLRSREDILKEARQKDEMLLQGEVGALHGLPMTVKDCFWVKGLKTSNGHPLYWNYVAQEDAELVKRLKNAGAIIIGKTNLPLFSIDWQATNFWNGRTSNPHDLSRVPGGSSGGSAAVVASGCSPIELGGRWFYPGACALLRHLWNAAYRRGLAQPWSHSISRQASRTPTGNRSRATRQKCG